MLIDIDNGKYALKDLYIIDLLKVLNWIKNSEDGQFVKNKEDVSIDTLKKEHQLLTKSSNGFFLGLYKEQSQSLYGYVSGEILQDKNTLFISMFMVDKLKRKKYVGTTMANILISFIKKEYPVNQALVSVDKLNVVGIKFWRAMGFSIFSSKLIESEKTKIPREVLLLNKKL